MSKIEVDQTALDEVWASVNCYLKLKDDRHSPVMQASALMISPDDGLQVKCVWAHEGNIRSEWISVHLLEEHRYA